MCPSSLQPSAGQAPGLVVVESQESALSVCKHTYVNQEGDQVLEVELGGSPGLLGPR